MVGEAETKGNHGGLPFHASAGLLGLGHVPDAAGLVAGYVAGLLVPGKGVERLVIIGPHLGAVGAIDDRPLAVRLGALVVAVGLALRVLVVGVEGHSLVVGKHLAGGRIPGLGRIRGEGAGAG